MLSYIKDSKEKFFHAARCLLRSFGQIYDFIYSIHLQCICIQYRGFWQFTFHRVHCNYDSQNSFSVHYYSQTLKLVNHSFTKISLPPPPPLSFFTESTVYLFTSCLWSPGFVWPDTCAKYWITFLVFSVFPAPDSPLKPKWKHCLWLIWGTNRGMTIIIRWKNSHARLKLTSGNEKPTQTVLFVFISVG